MIRRQPRLGKVQFQIMRTLWQQGTCTARAITEELSKSGPIAHSTVQTLLRQLEAKGIVAHEPEGRTFVFRALIEPSEVTATPLHELLVRVYQGSVYNLMSHLLKHENVSQEEIDQLRQLLDEEKPQ
jgi:BlaI family penicillinase repressor